MKSLLLLMLSVSLGKPCVNNLVINFGNSPGRCQDWVLLSDNIMGGVTKSAIEYRSNSVVLSGDISLDNYGGFASIKTRFREFNLSDYKGIRIRSRAKNQQFAFTLEDSKNWTMPNYKHSFTTGKDDTWELATIHFKEFDEYQIGESTGNKIGLERLSKIVRLGIITTEKKEGPFSLEVDYVEFF